MEEAKSYFDQAMALLDTLAETDANAELRISLLANQRWVMIHLFKMAEYYDLLIRYEVLLTKTVNPRLVGSFYERLGFCEWFFGLLDGAVPNLTKAAEISEMVENAEEAGHAYTFLAWTYLWTGDFAKVLAFTAKAVRHIEQDFDIRTPVVALNACSLALSFLGRWDEAIQEGKRSLRAAREFSDNTLICQASFILGTAYALKGELGIAADHMEIALEKAKTPMDHGFAQLFRAPSCADVEKWSKELALWSPCSAGFNLYAVNHLLLFAQHGLVKGIGLPGSMTRHGRCLKMLSKTRAASE